MICGCTGLNRELQRRRVAHSVDDLLSSPVIGVVGVAAPRSVAVETLAPSKVVSRWMWKFGAGVLRSGWFVYST
jgi:hypothetical protein